MLVPIVILRVAGVLEDTEAGIVAGACVSLAAVLFLVSPVAAGRSPGQWLATGASALVVLAASLLPGLDALLSGAPLAREEVQKAGERIALPRGLEGCVRVIVHASLPERGEAVLAVVIGGAQDPIEARFERRITHQRSSGGSKRHVAFRDPDSKAFIGRIPAGTDSLRIEELVGQPREPIRIEIFRPPIDTAFLAAAVVLALLVVLVVATRVPLRENALAGAGFCLGFGLDFGLRATPGSALHAVVAALIIGGLLGGAVGAVVGRLANRRSRR